MAVVVGHGVVPIKPDFGADFHRNIQREGAKATDGLTKQFGGAFKKIAALSGSIFVGAQVIGTLKSAFSEAAEAQKVGRLTEQVIKTTGGAAKITAKQIGDLSSAISNKTAIDDETIQSGANLIATFTKVRNEAGKGNDIFSQTVAVANDMSVALGQDMKSSSLQLGKALNDPIKGVTALTRAGVSFTQGQKDQIKKMQESGDLLGAQKLILAEVQTQFGGAAAAVATPVERLKVVWGNLLEEIGTRMMPVVENLAEWLGERLPGALDTAGRWFSILSDKVTPVFRFIVDDAIPGIRNAVSQLTSGFAGGDDSGIFGRLGATARNVYDFLTKTVIPGLQRSFGSFLAGFRGEGGAGSFFTDLGEAARTAVRIFNENVLPVLKAVVGFIQDHLKPILIALGVVFAVILAPLVLLVGGFIYAYQRFEVFRDIISVAMAVVKTVVTTAIDVMIVVFQHIVGIIQNVVLPIFNVFRSFLVDIVFPIIVAVINDIVLPAFRGISTVVSTVWDAVRPIFEAIVSFVVDKLGPPFEAMVDIVSRSFGAIPGVIQGALRIAGSIVAGFLDSVGGIADAIGLDDIAKVLRNGAGSARKWGVEGVATSDTRSGGQGRGLAKGGYINGPNVNRDVVPAMLMPGEFVVRKSAVEKYGPGFMEAINAGHFAKGGLIPDLGDLARGAVDKARSLGTAALERVWPMIDVGGGAFTKGGIPAGGVNYIRDAIFKLIRGKESEGKYAGSGSVGGAGAAAAAVWIRQAMGLTGTPDSWFNTLMARAKLESGFNPRAINLWDSNAKAGHPSKGLFQTIDGTFNRYKLPGHGDIWNPVDNAAAAMQYIKARYGTIFNINPRTGYADGGLVHLRNFDSGGVLSPGWNAVRNDTGRDEHVVPRGAGPLVGVVNLHNREDVDEFWRRAEFAAMAGHL